jgi:hypothetical protein
LERDQEKLEEEEVIRAKLHPQQSLTKQEQFGEVWKERKQAFGQRRLRAHGGVQSGGTAGERTPGAASISLLTCRCSSHRSCQLRAPQKW